MSTKILALFLGFAVALAGVAVADDFILPSRLSLRGPGTTANPTLRIINNTPVMEFRDSDAAVDEKRWQWFTNGPNLTLNAYNDAGGTSLSVINILRTATTSIPEINLVATQVKASGVEVGPRALIFNTAQSLAAVNSGIGIVVGQTAIIEKLSNTGRNTTVTATDDPDLQFTSVPVGRYLIDAQVWIETTTTTTQGFKFNFTGTNNTQNGICFLIGGVNPTTTATHAIASTVDQALTSTSFGAANTIYPMTCSGVSAITSTGKLSVAWAQQTSNANNSVVNARSFLRVTRIN